MKSAVLFYNDGQVKFTNRVVGPHQWSYTEDFLLPMASAPVRTSFTKIGESSHFILFGEA
jgi:hypothetical protein